MITDIDPILNKKWQDENWEPKRYQYNVRPGDTLMDLGAYQGEWAKKMYDTYDCKVIAVDPTPAILHFNGHSHITVINKAAWVENGKREFGGNAYYTSAHVEGKQT